MTSTDSTPPPPPGGNGAVPPPPSRPVRRTGDRVVAGVAAGLGRHFGIDPVLVRILFVITTFAAGLGALAYLVLWVVLPLREAGPPTAGASHSRGTGFWLGAAAVTIGGIIALAQLPAPRVLVPLALIAVGVALWQRPSGTSGTGPAGQPGAPAPRQPAASHGSAVAPGAGAAGSVTGAGTGTSGASAAAEAGAAGVTGPLPDGGGTPGRASPGSDGSPPSGEVRWWVPPEPRPAPSWLGPITVALALLVTGIVAALGVTDFLELRSSDLVATALLVLAGGLLVGAFFGRAKWLALPAGALAAMLVVLQLASAYGVELAPRIGESFVSSDRLTGTMEADHALGEIQVDLADAQIGSDALLDVDIGIGRAAIILPDDVAVRLEGQVGAGAVNWHVASGTDPETGQPLVFRETVANGRDLHLDELLGTAAGDAPVLRVDVAAGIGAIDLYRGWDVYAAERGRENRWFFESRRDPGRGFVTEATKVPGDPAVVDWFLEEGCPPVPGAVAGSDRMLDCWTRVTGEAAVVQDVRAEDAFFDDFCMDPFLVADTPDLVGECLQVLEASGADVRIPEEES